MPFKYLLETSDGKKFNVEFEKEPSNEEMNRAVEELSVPSTISKAPNIPIKHLPWIEPIRAGAEMGGLLFGGAVGTATMGPGLGTATGAGLGYAAVRQALSRGMEFTGIQKPQSFLEATGQAAIDIPTGAATEMTGQLLPKVLTGVGKGLTYPWGAYTGAGSKSLQEAYKRGKGFTQYMRGQGSLSEVVQEARTGLNALKELRANEYVPEIEAIGKIKGNLNLNPLYKELDTQMTKFNITVKPKSMGGGFDYTNSILEADSSAQKEFENIYNMIEMRKSGGATIKPKDVDILKRNLGDYYSPNNKIRSLTTNLEVKTRDILESSIPNYKEITAKYAKDTQIINEVTKDFSIGDKVSYETGLKKLTNSMNENAQFKQDLLSLIKSKTGVDLMPKLAGLKMQPMIPTSLVGRMGGMYEIFKIFESFDPKIVIAMSASSPRITGEFLHALGKIGPTIIKGARYTPQAIQASIPGKEPNESIFYTYNPSTGRIEPKQ